jgi:arylsulfatase A-like enzyme
MSSVRNVLLVMCDQLRADHLGCYGHPYLRTRNIDALAARGVRFSRAFVQSGVCGPSRMSFYTGRYMSSHGATWNRVPLSIGQTTLGEYLRVGGVPLLLSGKTHVLPDTAGLERLRIEPESEDYTLRAKGGFEEVDRHDGHHAETDSAYANYLRSVGYNSPDPWTDHVISAVDASGEVVSGWHMRNAHLPARVAERHSETAYTTDRAIAAMSARGEEPWALHLSYVKPHWPYLAPAPYHNLYSIDQCRPLVRSEAERTVPHPVYAAYLRHEESENFAREEVAQRVRPVYQGLIQQVDDHLGRVWEWMDSTGRWQDTMVIVTADHGDYLGDHWLGEKELFHDCVQRVPLIVYDPSSAADATRGTVEGRFVEAIDLLPTMLAALGKPWPGHIVEGRPLQPLLHGARLSAGAWRDCVFSELDYAFRAARLTLGRKPDECRAWMVRTAEWKYVHWQGFPPQLFHLAADPDELVDLGRDPSAALEAVREGMRRRLLDWHGGRKMRVTLNDAEVERRTDAHKRAGVHFGQW